MSKDYKLRYEEWLNSAYIDEKSKIELIALGNNEKEIQDRFYKDLEFGTGGLRGIIGIGTNRMNIYTVRKATQGLANYILSKGKENKGVAIAYDSRNMSIEFSEETALVLNANGIKTYRFDALRPTPELSFAVRELGCVAGIVITASHNPAEYNGYKVYWEDGGQIVPPYDKEIIEEVNKIENFNQIKTISKEEAIERGLYNIIGKNIDDRYIEELKKLILNRETIEEMAKSVKIVYTPLHGTGNVLVQRILKELGFKNVYVVPEQEKPNGDFPTVSYPNPEDEKAFDLALKLAKKVDADIVLATDPDADRLGVYAKDVKTNEYKSFNGNMSGLLIAEYELSQKKANGVLLKNGALVKTIVSSNMANKMVKEYNIKLIEVLTGFKYIGEKIKEFEEENSYTYIFGYEESYGCLIGTYARDKDAISAVMALCEATAFYKKNGLTLWNQMINIYEKYGYYKEGLYSVTLEGIDGAEKIKEIMQRLRDNPIKNFGEFNVVAIRDYEKSIRTSLKDNKREKIELPKSNVLYYELENEEWFCVRPSGTEPKIKLYLGIKANNIDEAKIRLEKLNKQIIKLMK